MDTLEALCRVLDVHPGALFEREDDSPKPAKAAKRKAR
jgi:DNA-binding Xre family transcriptional regulator